MERVDFVDVAATDEIENRESPEGDVSLAATDFLPIPRMSERLSCFPSPISYDLSMPTEANILSIGGSSCEFM